MSKNYIYNLPFEVNRDLCRLLDVDDNWKELAGIHMKFKAFDINEMELTAKRNQQSPTGILLTRWGQLNHRVEELFVLLYKMQHIPAMHCLKHIVEQKFLKLLNRNGSKNGVNRPTNEVDVNGNRANPLHSRPDGSQAFIPRPVVELELGVHPHPQSSSGIGNCPFATESSRGSSSVTSSSQDSHSHYHHHPHNGDVNAEIIRQVSAIPQFRYEKLREATNNWHETNLLGQGGFGQVYKGELNLLTVAVKRLKNDGKNRELIREMCLNQYRHDNILPLYGFSLGGSEACLVYQLMTGGSLEQRLRGRAPCPPLTWAQRHGIALGVARGLQFLHTMSGTPLIHGDIKPANILLDQCGIPKIGDFGLARKGPYGEDRTHLKVSKVHGTRPYLPDEYLRSHCLSPAVDVFSFGVVLLELATALPPLDRARQGALLSDHIQQLAKDGQDLSYLEDRTLINTPQSNPALTRMFLACGVWCTATARHARPDMLHVYRRIHDMPLHN